MQPRVVAADTTFGHELPMGQWGVQRTPGLIEQVVLTTVSGDGLPTRIEQRCPIPCLIP